jgi:cytochrome P450
VIEFFERLTTSRITSPERNKVDIFGSLLQVKGPETLESLPAPELISESALLIIAGSGSVATALSATFFYLSRSPSAYKKVTEEIRSTFSSANSIYPSPQLTSCRYLRACIDEAMRLAPSVTGAQWREVQTGGAIIDGQHIPAGYDVGTGTYALHHNADYFPEPFSFKPERWLVDEVQSQGSLDSVRVSESAFAPFSTGPRGCAGKNLAYRTMTVTMAMVLYRFDFRQVTGKAGKLGEGRLGAAYGRHRDGEFQILETWASTVDGPLLQFRQRDGIVF